MCLADDSDPTHTTTMAMSRGMVVLHHGIGWFGGTPKAERWETEGGNGRGGNDNNGENNKNENGSDNYKGVECNKSVSENSPLREETKERPHKKGFGE